MITNLGMKKSAHLADLAVVLADFTLVLLIILLRRNHSSNFKGQLFFIILP